VLLKTYVKRLTIHTQLTLQTDKWASSTSYFYLVLVGFGAATRCTRDDILLRFVFENPLSIHIWPFALNGVNVRIFFCVGNCIDKLSRERRKNRHARGGIVLPFFLQNLLNIRIWQLAINATNIR
jgi:hypothetical protein